MKIIAKNKCQLEGRIYDVGETANYDGPITERIAFNFSGENGEALVVGAADGEKKTKPAADNKPDNGESADKAKIENVLKTMNREQIMAKLDERGITYKPAHKNDYLAKLYLQSMGELD